LTKEASIKTKNHSEKENKRNQKCLTKEANIKTNQSINQRKIGNQAKQKIG
jgi:hypothetical protein